ncbi:cyclic pyranopterin monophosphate synthase MoaC [uncultured Sunxiuqinia sp.]|uniref:cyclic pyranopterin monophosphate synthase MoaC n=1 Tax=uncultured Sunxiuqinia sp. TaxID=1573825 RepID=UPI0030D9D698|tara:strand:- start:2997 stop:3446 length:450 start_codon:yes stop_codon:yes gene_type:complete
MKLTHIDDKGKANMVDVGYKPMQEREAVASGKIILSKETIRQIKENLMKKGDVLTMAQIAGIQAAKKTSSLIPLCHPLLLSKIDVKPELLSDGVKITAMVKCTGQTGVEMEALTSVSVALLTIYDMCKAIDKNMVIEAVKLLEKTKKDI